MTFSTNPSGEQRAERLVSMFLGDRIEDANEPPGLREAVIDRVALAAENIRERGQDRSTNCGHRPVGASPMRI